MKTETMENMNLTFKQWDSQNKNQGKYNNPGPETMGQRKYFPWEIQSNSGSLMMGQQQQRLGTVQVTLVLKRRDGTNEIQGYT